MTELPATPIPDDEVLKILTADKKVLPENIPLAAAIDAALAALDTAINSHKLL